MNRYPYIVDNLDAFNDPTGNTMAYQFGGQAYSIHPVAPVPMPAPPPAPSQPATPPPSTPASPSNPNYGNSVTTQSSPSKLGFGAWFEQDFFPTHCLEIAGDIATVAGILLGVPGIFTTRQMLAVMTPGITASITGILTSPDATQQASAFLSLAMHMVEDVLASMSYWQELGVLFAIGASNAVMIVGSAGILEGAKAAAAVFAGGIELGILLTDITVEWSQYNS